MSFSFLLSLSLWITYLVIVCLQVKVYKIIRYAQNPYICEYVYAVLLHQWMGVLNMFVWTIFWEVANIFHMTHWATCCPQPIIKEWSFRLPVRTWRIRHGYATQVPIKTWLNDNLCDIALVNRVAVISYNHWTSMFTVKLSTNWFT